MKHEMQVWQSEGRKEILADEAAALKEYERVALEEAKLKSDAIRVVRWMCARKWRVCLADGLCMTYCAAGWFSGASEARGGGKGNEA